MRRKRSEDRLAEIRRHALEQERLRRRKKREQRRIKSADGTILVELPPEINTYRTYSDELVLPKSSRSHVRMPSTFSFLDNPDQTIEALNKVASSVISPACQEIELLLGSVKSADHASLCVLTALALESSRRMKKDVFYSAPSDPSVHEMLIVAGLPKFIEGVKEDSGEYMTLDLFMGSKGSNESGISTSFETAATRLSDYVHACLNSVGYGLDRSSKGNLLSLASEVLENAERHSLNSNWWMSAFCSTAIREPSADSLLAELHITFFNFGRSIYSSLETLPASAKLRRDIDSLITLHEEKGTLRRLGLSKEDLWTLYALQDGVSCKNRETELLGTNGKGLAELIRFFQVLGGVRGRSAGAVGGLMANLRPRMCLVSGRTAIQFDHRYHISERVWARGGARRVIAFNPRNDLRDAPDSTCIQGLGNRFPGTIVSMRLSLDKEHLDSLTSGNGNHDTH